ncbi:MAG: ribonuclease III [Victivallaceae bacterium]|nr:ribonuclease III [Victivallaceae bacterium]
MMEALTHPSYAWEHSLSFDYQRLEFLGDAVLGLIQSDYLFNRYPEKGEGVLSKVRSVLERESTLAELAEEIGIHELVRLGHGEQMSGGDRRASILADVFEAVVAATYLMSGLDNVSAKVVELVEARFGEPLDLVERLNPKGALQEYCQAHGGEKPSYAVLSVEGAEHDPTYTAEARACGLVAVGHGGSKKAAETDAAGKLLDFLKGGK